MALSAFSERFAVYDITPVENLFLLEYMPYAPGDYVRVYLYGLMQCRHQDPGATIDTVARVLNMRPEQVLSAFSYWEQKGLVVRLSDNPPSFEYENVRSAMLKELSEAGQDGVYQYREYVAKLGSMLGELEARHHAMAMDWVEDLKLPQGVVLLTVREKLDQLTDGGRRKRSMPYLFKVFEATMLDFAERGIRTPELAEKELSRGRPGFKLAVKVLDYFNLRRSPTTAEAELADKWLTEWNLDEKAVLGALKQTASSSSPSFAYLDRILERHSNIAGDAQQSMEQDRALFELTKQLLTELGMGNRAPSEDQRKAVQHWLDQGFEPDALIRAAIRCNRSARRSFDQLELELRRWHELGIVTSSKAEEYNRQQAELRLKASQAFERAGIDRRPAEADLDQLREWLKVAPFELVLFAAECAHGLKLPTRAMAKNLSEWAKKGITDVEAARAERASRTRVPAAGDAKKPDAPAAKGYEQRAYEQGFFEDFFADLGEEKGAESK